MTHNLGKKNLWRSLPFVDAPQRDCRSLLDSQELMERTPARDRHRGSSDIELMRELGSAATDYIEQEKAEQERVAHCAVIFMKCARCVCTRAKPFLQRHTIPTSSASSVLMKSSYTFSLALNSVSLRQASGKGGRRKDIPRSRFCARCGRRRVAPG